MRAHQLLVLACASLAVSADKRYKINVEFNKACVRKCGGDFEDWVKARECIETVPRVPGLCDYAKLRIAYTVHDEDVACWSDRDGGLVRGFPTGDLVRELSNMGYESMYFEEVDFLFENPIAFLQSGACDEAFLEGTGDSKDRCTYLTQELFPMTSDALGSVLTFKLIEAIPRKWILLSNFTDLAIQAHFGEGCVPQGRVSEVRLKLAALKAIEATVGIKDATIVFPDQPDCAPRGCNAIVGARGVKVCLDNARKAPSCKRAVYTRTYFNLGTDHCDSKVSKKIFLNMDSVLADDKALDFEDKHTVVTSVNFAHKPAGKRCTAVFLALTKSCNDVALAKSNLEAYPPGSFSFRDNDGFSPAEVLATNYTLTTRCPFVDNPDGNEVTLKTEFTISHLDSSVTFTGDEKSTAGVAATTH